MNFRAFLVLAKTAGSARTNESMIFIWIVWSTLYLYLWSKVKFISLNIISYTHVNPIRGATFTTNAFIFNFNHFFLSFFSRKQNTQFLPFFQFAKYQNILWLWWYYCKNCTNFEYSDRISTTQRTLISPLTQGLTYNWNNGKIYNPVKKGGLVIDIWQVFIDLLCYHSQ